MGQSFHSRLGFLGLILLLVLLVVPSALAQEDGVTIITTENVNLRALPGPFGGVLAVVPYDTSLTAVAINSDGTWVCAAYEGVLGWIDVNYVTVEEGSLEDLPVASNPPPPAPDGTAATISGVDEFFALWESTHDTNTDAAETTDSQELTITEPVSGSDLPSDQVRMSWLAVDGAESYRIEVYSNQAEVSYTASYRTTATSILIPTANIPTRSLGWGYWIEVSAIDEDGNTLAEGNIWVRRITPTTSSSQGSGSGGPPGGRR